MRNMFDILEITLVELSDHLETEIKSKMCQ